jgi:hypothetical protein
MTQPDMNRRDFTRWTAAAFGGVVAGSMAGCAGESGTQTPAPATGESGAAATGEGDRNAAESGAAAEGSHDVAYLIEEPHVCRGLNTCEGKGAGGDNACAGQGTCHTANKHTCHYENECKGQGGCGANPGQNACKAKGECAVPLGKSTWETARAAFEKAMADAGKQVGAAPAVSGGPSF